MTAGVPRICFPPGVIPPSPPKRISMTDYLHFIQFARRAFPETDASRRLRDRRGPRAAFRLDPVPTET